MDLKRLCKRAAILAVLAIVAGLVVIARAVAQVPPPNNPPPGAYQPIPNFSGVGAGLLFRSAINDRFSGAQPIAPAVASLTFANLPTEQDGLLYFCNNCLRTSPCAAGGSGAWARGERGAWQCTVGTLEANLNANNFKVASLAAASNAGDALSYGQTGAQINTLSGSKSDGSNALSNFNVNGVFNVKAYGAKGDYNTDDTTAVQNTINAACAATSGNTPFQIPTVYFPNGSYRHSFPWIINCTTAMSIVGAGEQNTGTYLANSQTLIPHFIFEPSGYVAELGTLTAANLATGAAGTHALNWVANSPHWYELKDAQAGGSASGPWNNGQPLNGMSAFSWESFADLATTTNAAYYIGSSTGNDNNHNTFGALNFNVVSVSGTTASLQFCLTLSTSGRVCATNSMSTNAAHFLEGSYDGSTVRLFVDGVAGTNASGTGTIVEAVTEALTLGAQEAAVWEDAMTFQWVGQLDSVRLSNIARHTANYTAPTAKLTSDANTMLLINGTAFNDALMYVDQVYGTGGAGAWIYAYQNFPGVTGAERHHISDMSMTNGSYGVLTNWSFNGSASNLFIAGMSQAGFFKWNVSYGWDEDNIYIQSNGYGQCGYEASSASGVVNSRHLKVSGGIVQMCLNNSSGVYDDGYFLTEPPTQTGISASGLSDDLYYFLNPIFDSENGGSVIPLRFSSEGIYHVIQGSLGTVSGSGSPALNINPNGLQVNLDGTQISVDNTATPISITNSSGGLLAPVTLTNANINNVEASQWPYKLASDMTKVQVIGATTTLQKLAGTRGDGGNTIDSYSVNSVQDIKAYGAVCSNTTTSCTLNGTTSATCSGISSSDFKVNQHVHFDHGGAASALSTPTLSSVTEYTYNLNPRPEPITHAPGTDPAGCKTDSTGSAYKNATCTTSWSYAIVNVAQNGSWSAPSSVVTVTNGAATLSADNYNRLSWTTDPNAVGTLIYGCSGSSCTPTLFAVLPRFPVGGTTGVTQVYDDMGNHFGSDQDFGTTKQSSAVAADLNTTIASINGNTVTLNIAAGQTGTFIMHHDNAPAIQSALSAVCPVANGNNCGTVDIPRCSGYWELGQAVSFYGMNGPKIVGANGPAQGSFGSAFQWDGPTGGIVLNLNASNSGFIEGLAFPGHSGNTPGLVYSADNYNTSVGPGGNPDSRSATTLTAWKFAHDEVGSAGVAWTIDTNASIGNVEDFSWEDFSCDNGNNKNGYACFYGSSSQTDNEHWSRGDVSGPRFRLVPHIDWRRRQHRKY